MIRLSIFLISFFLLSYAIQAKANSNNIQLECVGVVRDKFDPYVANWDFIKIDNSAELKVYYDNKYRIAKLRVSNKTNDILLGNGKWFSKITNAARSLLYVRYIKSEKTFFVEGPESFRAEGKCKNIAVDIQLPGNQTFKSFIKEMVFIIKEHSGYAIAHPKDKDNVKRHLKHTCHALDPTTIKERPMPAPEIGLTKAIKRYLTKSKVKPIYITIDSLADEFIKLCKETVYSPNKNSLLSLAKKINSKFTLLYNKL